MAKEFSIWNLKHFSLAIAFQFLVFISHFVFEVIVQILDLPSIFLFIYKSISCNIENYRAFSLYKLYPNTLALALALALEH